MFAVVVTHDQIARYACSPSLAVALYRWCARISQVFFIQELFISFWHPSPWYYRCFNHCFRGCGWEAGLMHNSPYSWSVVRNSLFNTVFVLNSFTFDIIEGCALDLALTSMCPARSRRKLHLEQRNGSWTKGWRYGPALYTPRFVPRCRIKANIANTHSRSQIFR